eukprot:TRINITY_DN4278_c0_g1_i3.p1 TRINITY_DN4278_c0_g1~~TRINITY_DN4278_c0_g1_i3.p1  ORF type:complete len:117 (-),score=25.55 TRINITY_DN4278_c0_g1_i3:496-846(-)
MGRVFKRFLSGDTVWTCSKCNCHLAHSEERLSKAFNGRHGRAFLFNDVVNVFNGEEESRTFSSGKFLVSDIKCVDCCVVVGWKYEEAMDESQKFKVGKFILERTLISKDNTCSEDS